MDCPKCGSLIRSPGRFCVKCGLDFGTEAAERIAFCLDVRGQVEHFAAQALGRVELYKQPSESLPPADVAPVASSDLPPASALDLAVAPLSDPPPSTATPPSPRSAEPEGLESRIGQKWMLIAGLLTMVFGIGYFLKYSFDQGWVGPAGRVAAAYLWGISFLVAGDRLRKRYEKYGLSLIGGGFAVLYFAAYAAFDIYHLFGQGPSFAVMTLVTALAGALSVRYDEKRLAILGLAGGFLTPLMLSTGNDNMTGQMGYLTILNLGLLGIAFRKRWEILNTLGCAFTWLLYVGWHMSHYSPERFWPAILFVNIFFLIHSVAPFAYQFLEEGRERTRGHIATVPNSLVAFGLCYSMIETQFGVAWVSIASLFHAATFLGMATFLAKKGRGDRDAFTLLLAKSALFLIVTVPLLFSGHWMTVFWGAQALALLWIGIRLDRAIAMQGAYALFAIAVGKFLFHDYETIFRFWPYEFRFVEGWTHLLAERIATTVVLLCTLYGAGRLGDKHAGGISFASIDGAVGLRAASGVLLFIALNVEVAGFFNDRLPSAAFAATSVLWTLFAVTLTVAGIRRNRAALRKAGIALFLVTLIKVFLSDMSNVSTPFRIVSFILLGIVLVGVSFLYHRFRDRIGGGGPGMTARAT